MSRNGFLHYSPPKAALKKKKQKKLTKPKQTITIQGEKQAKIMNINIFRRQFDNIII